MVGALVGAMSSSGEVHVLVSLGRQRLVLDVQEAEGDQRADDDHHAGYVADTGLAHLPDLRRYLRAMLQRLEKSPSSPAALARDAANQEVVDRVEIAYADLLDSLPVVERRSAPVRDVGWMVEELRVSLFANALGTAYPVSEKRIRAAIGALG